jgi:hypothetical protein
MLISDLKSHEAAYTPLLLFECVLVDGTEERWCTHRVTANGKQYEARVLGHTGFEFRLGGEDRLDLGNRLTLTVANVDGRIAQIDSTVGWRGARLRVRFGFFDLANNLLVSSLAAVFAGIANPIEELTERQARLSFLNRLSLSRLEIPQLRIQSRCPWQFPGSEEERQEAVDGGAKGKYSPFYRCGYSPDVENGRGNLDGTEPFTSCGYTREHCRQRGMYDQDNLGRRTARFGGFDFLPSGLLVRTHGAGEHHWSETADGRARPNDTVPHVYGTAWIEAPVIFARDDGNLTHCEVLLGVGPIEGVRKVVANGVEIPLAEDERDMSGTGWYRVLTYGDRDGAFNTDFSDGSGAAMGDPHGSLACLALVLPNQIVERGKLPKVEVLLDGLRLPKYDAQGNIVDIAFTRNPAWVLLDLFRLAGWQLDEIDLQSFVETAQYCDEFIQQTGLGGEHSQGPRYEANLALVRRRSLSEVVRGVRIASGLMISLDWAGRLLLRPETTLRKQHPEKGVYSNAAAPLNDGWPAYEFGDGTNGFSGIVRRRDGESSFRLYRKSSGEVPNRLTAAFADALRNYEPDVLSLVDFEDVRKRGCEVSAPVGALGLPHFDQAARMLRLQLEKTVGGNQYIEFETSVQAFGLRPGDIITVSHAKHGFLRMPFRLLKLAAGLNFESARITAQIHNDAWYERAAGEAKDGETNGLSLGRVPHSLAGRSVSTQAAEEYLIEEIGGAGDGGVELSVRYTPPGKPVLSGPQPPMLNLNPEIQNGGGILEGARTLYYALTSVDSAGNESTRSFVVEARLPGSPGGYAVSLKGIQMSGRAVAVRVYRGESPSRLRRIAEGLPADGRFTDTGLAATVIPLPDPNFDHARFHWRVEFLPPTSTDIYGATTIGNSSLGLLPDEYKGAAVRILRGKGAGQERVIALHTASEIHVSPPWRVPPDQSSIFAIAESSWKPAGVTRTDEIRFVVPGGIGSAIQVQGIAVSSRGMESPESEALVCRHELSISAVGDADVPPMPNFGLSAPGHGAFIISGIGFPTLRNTRSIRTGTLTVHYWDELQSPSTWHLAQALGEGDQWVYLSAAAAVEQGDLVQIDQELLRVLEVHGGGSALLVDRGVHDTASAVHLPSTSVYPLRRLTSVMAFSKGLFGSPASGSFSRRIALPNARLAAAELYVTNDRGASPTAYVALTATADQGLRTMSGGQYTFQYDGELALMESIAPPLVVESTRAVRDVLAEVERAPQGFATTIRILVDGTNYAELSIPPGGNEAIPVSCFDRPPLLEGSRIVVSVVSVGTGANSYPGKGLTVTMRL